MHILKPFDIKDFNTTLPRLSQLYPGGFLPQSAGGCFDTTDLLIMVFSAPNNHVKRQAIRDNWGRDATNSTRLLFLVGGANLSDYQLTSMQTENFVTDVVFADFIDHYFNLTLKSVAMLDWVDLNCFECSFLLKCDDDMYINVPALREKLRSEPPLPEETMVGHLVHNWQPNRNSESKYFLSKREFPAEVLPDFVTGPAYLVTGALVRPLLEAALDEHWLTLEDVFLTGIVAGARLEVKLTNWKEFLNERVGMTPCNARQIAIHEVRPAQQKSLMRARTRTCHWFQQK